MPLPLMLAMILAFGLRLPSEAAPLSTADLFGRLRDAGLAVVAVGGGALVFGLLIQVLATRAIVSPSRRRRLYLWGSRLLLVAGLSAFAWTLISLDWHRVVGWGLGLKNIVVVEQAVLISPFLLTQVLIWCGLYPAERVMLPWSADRSFTRYMLLKMRYSFGMMIPMALLYGLSRQVGNLSLPPGFSHPVLPLLGSLLIGAFVFVISPAFVRLSWPTRRLPDGALRDRLERLARRLKFRYTEILLWDTGGLVVNAGVTGAVPWFRYVLITDAMIEVLDDQEIEAVFGHEVGHIAHWHLPFFAFFCLGSMGLMTLVFEGASRVMDLGEILNRRIPDPTTAEVVMASLQLGSLGLYFYLVFGFLSRQFERQADVFGCKAVSCGQPICLPHHDPNAPGVSDTIPTTTCPSGIHLFAEALSQVAEINGTSATAYSWRHGSIADRISFLLSLESGPAEELRFQRRVRTTRWVLLIVLGSASLGALLLLMSELPS